MAAARLDRATVRAKGGDAPGRHPTDRGKPGTKRPVVVDAHGIPLAIRLSAAHGNDVTRFATRVEAIEPIKRPLGRPRKRPAQWHADKAYDAQRGRDDLRRRGIAWRIARQGIEASERLGRYRWVVGRTLAWRNQVRRLPVRYARRATIHQAFLDLGCALIGWNLLQAVFC